MLANIFDGFDDKVELFEGERVMQIDAEIARPRQLVFVVAHLPNHVINLLCVHLQRIHSVHSRASTAAAALNAKQIVHQRGNEVVVQILCRRRVQSPTMPHQKRDDGQSMAVRIANESQVCNVAALRVKHVEIALLCLLNEVRRQIVLDHHGERAAHRSDNVRSAAFLSFLDILAVLPLAVVDAIGDKHSSSAWHHRHIVCKQRFFAAQNSRTSRTSQEFVRRHKHCVFRVHGKLRVAHIDVAIRRRRGIVPKRQRAKPVQQGSGTVNGR
mmetsp:Transcript_49985/g.79640  ORF Transcript_49985/g.79640 Transcript_49985/m.79640 type:complete len:270 (-) Transcript_49985:564-1373(-)